LFSIFNFDFKLAQNCIKKSNVAAIYAKKVGKTAKEIKGLAVA
jgi:hypothetical protein